MSEYGYLQRIADRNTVITIIDSSTRFPELLSSLLEKYRDDVQLFQRLIAESDDSSALLARIRDGSRPSSTRMSLLKMFRRCVAPILDTETTKKIRKISSETLIEHYGRYFKPISTLKDQFSNLPDDHLSALVVLIGEYDSRGYQGYELTKRFFNWFETKFHRSMTIEGPRGAGKDIELSTIFPDFHENCPCDFVIKDKRGRPLCVGFARYDSTRGGAQSDDRTSGNSHKVSMAQDFHRRTGKMFRLLFVSDGIGLLHDDTWREACDLDGSWEDNVRVTTLALAERRVNRKWLTRSK